MEHLENFLIEELNIKPETVMPKFREYEQLLLEWNSKINLMSRKTESIEPHILNSIFFLSKYALKGTERLIDVGTGGGFPGIPLKILFPGLNITLLDSIQKKVGVLQDVIRKMKLPNIRAVYARAEVFAEEKNEKGKYDIVTAKAVAPLEKLYSWNKYFLSKSGKMQYIKGGDIEQELRDLKKAFPGVKYDITPYNFPVQYQIEDKKLVTITN